MDGGGEAVLVAGEIEPLGHAGDELGRHLDLGVLERAAARGRRLDVLAVPQLRGPADGVEEQQFVVGDEDRQVLLRVHHEARDADHALREHRLAQERVDLARLFRRREEIRLLEQHEGDLLGLDERLDLDRLRGDGVGSLDLVVAEEHVGAVLGARRLEPADDVVALDLLARALVDPLVADRIHRALVEPVEVDAAFLRRGVERDRDVDQSEGDRAAPGHARHQPLRPYQSMERPAASSTSKAPAPASSALISVSRFSITIFVLSRSYTPSRSCAVPA